MPYTLQQRIALVHSSIGGLTRDQAAAIANLCQSADAKGENSSTWHQSAIYFGRPEHCNCADCVKLRKAPQPRFTASL